MVNQCKTCQKEIAQKYTQCYNCLQHNKKEKKENKKKNTDIIQYLTKQSKIKINITKGTLTTIIIIALIIGSKYL